MPRLFSSRRRSAYDQSLRHSTGEAISRGCICSICCWPLGSVLGMEVRAIERDSAVNSQMMCASLPACFHNLLLRESCREMGWSSMSPSVCVSCICIQCSMLRLVHATFSVSHLQRLRDYWCARRFDFQHAACQQKFSALDGSLDSSSNLPGK